jgi:hypothetical protein
MYHSDICLEIKTRDGPVIIVGVLAENRNERPSNQNLNNYYCTKILGEEDEEDSEEEENTDKVIVSVPSTLLYFPTIISLQQTVF